MQGLQLLFQFQLKFGLQKIVLLEDEILLM